MLEVVCLGRGTRLSVYKRVCSFVDFFVLIAKRTKMDCVAGRSGFCVCVCVLY